ncbi:F-box only protein 16 [Megalobrama amblycephala]|uniref:F-box only protein 16 n=1 Tax=Megalobrama amblycephala TaxID=75352 RepID=UPI002013D6B4|nr:F-box only protein 16 [Megalobrama amblycephala]XP_048064054.1 F-box only protein 16 [Megalobrama amblycephala]
MPQAPRTKMQTKLSSWTPLNHQLSNANVFEERRNLLGKWFEKWTDSQRKQVLQDFFSRCSVNQLKHFRQTLSSWVPEEALDFTRVLPRVISLYIFSFLDPRSLCRCAQVSWHWKNLVELDQLWMPKCLKLGWCISFAPTPFEQGVWKRHYIETVQELHISRPKMPVKEDFTIPEVKVIGSEIVGSHPVTGHREFKSDLSSLHGKSKDGNGLVKSAKGLPPWRDSDRHPTDIIRFNYLDNLDPVEHARITLIKGKSASSNTTTQEKTTKAPSHSTYKLRKAKSLMFLSLDLSATGKQNHNRPQWAAHNLQAHPTNKDSIKRLSQTSQWNAGIRPGPVRPPVPRLSKEGLRASQRSHRSTPTVSLFDGQP